MGAVGVVYNPKQVVREGLTEKEIFEKRLEGEGMGKMTVRAFR